MLILCLAKGSGQKLHLRDKAIYLKISDHKILFFQEENMRKDSNRSFCLEFLKGKS